MYTPDQKWLLMSRSLCGEATPSELSELQGLLQADEELMQQYEFLKRYWSAAAVETHIGNENEAAVAKIILQSTDDNDTFLLAFEKNIRRRRKKRFFVYSLSAIAITCAGVWYFILNVNSPQLRHQDSYSVNVKYGNRSKTILPDGTLVWLNAGSKLQYHTFSDSLREVDLEGEAYFTVTHQPERPFIVHTSSMDIRVLGTTFNVKSYADEKTTETTLINGSVEIINKKSKNIISLKPNQKVVLYKENVDKENPVAGSKPTFNPVFPNEYYLLNLDTASQINERIETSWVYNRLIFRGDNFEELAKKMERWFDIKIVFTDVKVKALRFNGSFENETVDQAFNELSTAISFQYKINNHEIFISASP